MTNPTHKIIAGVLLCTLIGLLIYNANNTENKTEKGNVVQTAKHEVRDSVSIHANQEEPDYSQYDEESQRLIRQMDEDLASNSTTRANTGTTPQHVKSEEEKLLETYQGNSLRTGSQPYSSLYGRNRTSGDCTFVFNVSKECDYIVTIKDYEGDVVAHAYIKKGDTYSFSLPNGTYQPFWTAGNSWCPEKLAPNGLYGFFLEDISVGKDDPQYLEYQSLTYTLTAVRNGNFSPKRSNLSEAF